MEAEGRCILGHFLSALSSRVKGRYSSPETNNTMINTATAIPGTMTVGVFDYPHFGPREIKLFEKYLKCFLWNDLTRVYFDTL